MRDALNSLREVLEKEKAVYGDLLLLSEQQRDALINRQVDALTEVATGQGKLISHSTRIERQAKQSLQNLGKLLGLESAEPTIAEVLSHLNADDAKPLSALRNQIIQAAAGLALQNQINARLFENALDMIHFTMQLLAGSPQSPEACYPLPDFPRQPGAVLVDQRV